MDPAKQEESGSVQTLNPRLAAHSSGGSFSVWGQADVFLYPAISFPRGCGA